MGSKKILLSIIIPVLSIIFAFVIYKSDRTMCATGAEVHDELIYVAHAGGSRDGYIGTNSMEALIESVERGYKLIEVDITTSSDGKYILNHDWEYMSNRVAFAENSPAEYKTFSEYKIFNKFTAVTLDDLIDFLDEYKDIRIITDTKNKDYSVLLYIKSHFADYIDRFIPQVYLFEDYKTIKKLGYKDIIVTVYEMPVDIKNKPSEIYAQAKKIKPYAITIPDELLNSDEYIDALKPNEIRYFVHTINSVERSLQLFDYGIYGVYSDNLLNGDYMQYYNEKISEINKNMAELDDEQRDALNGYLIYGYESELCIIDGKAELIYPNALLSPFSDPEKSVAFLPLSRTLAYLGAENYSYIGAEQSSAFEYKGNGYKAGKNGCFKNGKEFIKEEKIHIFSNSFFASENFFRSIFDANVVKYKNLVIISSEKQDNIDLLLEVLETYFSF